MQLALIGRYYERIGDHAVNIGERVRYMVTGWLPEHTGAAAAADARSGTARPAERAADRCRRTAGPMRILVTNDDGIEAPGIARPGAAPWSTPATTSWSPRPIGDHSGCGRGDRQPAARRATSTSSPCELPGPARASPAFGVDGPPALAVMAGQPRRVRRPARPGRVRHQPGPQHRAGHAALRHRRRRAHRAPTSACSGAGGEHRLGRPRPHWATAGRATPSPRSSGSPTRRRRPCST